MFIKSSICGVLTLLSTTSAFALTCAYDYGGTASCAPDTTTAGNCETLGFSKNNVSNCEQYIYCPFDASYKRCASLDCTAYTLSSCPANGYCSSCKAGGYTHLALDGCNKGYVKSGNSCPANPCTGYPLSSCPSHGSCSSCLSGTANKYKLDSCSSGYKVSNNSCVCAKTCKDTATVPAHATAVKSSCTACGVTTTIITGFNCNDGYVKSGSSCVAKSCNGFPLSSCPTGATSCSTCKSGSSTKYKVNGCKSGYIKANNTCRKTYANCEAAGYFTDDTNRNCSSTTTIYLINGKTTECYTSCSCVNGYIENSSGSCIKEINLKQCPNGQHYYWGKCTNCSTLRSNCKKECLRYSLGIDIESCSANCDADYSACTSAPTTYSHGYGNGFKPSLMLALDTISEEQCKIMYSHNLTETLPEDDCATYNA